MKVQRSLSLLWFSSTSDLYLLLFISTLISDQHSTPYCQDKNCWSFWCCVRRRRWTWSLYVEKRVASVQSRIREHHIQLMKKDTWRSDWQEFKQTVKYDGPSLLVTVQMDSIHNATALADTGCQSYGLISEKYVHCHQLERIPIKPRRMWGFDGLSAQSSITQVARTVLNVGENHQACVYFYVVSHLNGSDIILGLSWMWHQNIWINSKSPTGVSVLHLSDDLHASSVIHEPKLEIHQISAASFHTWKHCQYQDKSVWIFAASMRDIEKAL